MSLKIIPITYQQLYTVAKEHENTVVRCNSTTECIGCKTLAKVFGISRPIAAFFDGNAYNAFRERFDHSTIYTLPKAFAAFITRPHSILGPHASHNLTGKQIMQAIRKITKKKFTK